jgi:hypothetical protein
MESRWFNVVVVVFWASTMSWLFITKILPPLKKGEPPNFLSVLAAEQAEPEEVRWRIQWDQRNIGFASHKVVHLRNGDAEIMSRVSIDQLPVKNMLPPPLQSQVLEALGGEAPVQLNWSSRLNVDVMGRLSGFRSTVRIGTVEGSTLQVQATLTGAVPLRTSLHLPSDALLGDALSPQSYLPGLRLGQEWTVPVFNPLRPDSAMEVLQATVPRDEWMIWNGEPVEARIVEFRSDPGAVSDSDGQVRARLWVAPAGKVLKQEVRILHSSVTFERVAKEKQTAGPRPDDVDSSPAFDGSP